MKFIYIPFILLLFAAYLHAEEEHDRNTGQSELEQTLQKIKHHHGGQSTLFLMADRLEYRSNEGDPLTVWDAQGWYGTDLNKFWLKTEGEFINDNGNFEEAEVQALYSRAISSFWDFQVGLRHDIKPTPTRNYAAFGLQGLAPYWFEIDTAGFISDEGNVSFRIETEYELLITQRLILQPRVEINIALQDDKPIGVGSGFNNIDAGLRLRYEIIREFAPYIGFSWNKSFGETADLKRGDGKITEDLSFVAGFRIWY